MTPTSTHPPMARACALLAVALLAPAAHAFTITPSYSDSPAWTPAIQSVITQACSDWTSRLAFNKGNSQNITVNFNFANGGSALGTYLAFWSFSRNGPVPNPYSPGMSHLITINQDFLPLSHTSLDAPSSSADGYDLLTVIRHELGHAMGFAYFTYLVGFFDPWSNRISDGIFDPDGLNIPMNSDKSHTAVMDDLMFFSLPPGVRKDVSDTDIAMLSLAYGYSALPSAAPEPASLSLLSLGALLLLRRRR